MTVGTEDGFGPAADHLLEETLKPANINGTFTYLEGPGHFDLDPAGWKPVHGGLLERIFREMDAVAKKKSDRAWLHFGSQSANPRTASLEVQEYREFRFVDG